LTGVCGATGRLGGRVARRLAEAGIAQRTYTSVAAGELSAVSIAVQQLTGHPATSLAELLRR
jgi:uncharacterized protein YbjT (DUF2867 family)